MTFTLNDDAPIGSEPTFFPEMGVHPGFAIDRQTRVVAGRDVSARRIGSLADAARISSDEA